MLAHMLPMNTPPSDPRGPGDGPDQGDWGQWYPQQRAQDGLYSHAMPQLPAQNSYIQQRQIQLCQTQRGFQADALSENEQAHRYPLNYRFPYAPSSALSMQAGYAVNNWPDIPPPSFQVPARKPAPEPPIVPHHNDVILGRGGKSHLHPGNEQLRQMAFVFRKVYVTSSKKAKSQLSRDLIKQVHALNPPGRFIQRNEATKMWKVVCEEKAREKTSQCLRDAVGGKGHAAYMKPRTEEEDALLREQLKGFNAEAVVRKFQEQRSQPVDAAGAPLHGYQPPPMESRSDANVQAFQKPPPADDGSHVNARTFQRLQSPGERTLVHVQEFRNQQLPPTEQDESSGMLQGDPTLSGQERHFGSWRGIDEMSTDEILLSEDPDGDDFGLLPLHAELAQPDESTDHAMVDETTYEFVTEFG